MFVLHFPLSCALLHHAFGPPGYRLYTEDSFSNLPDHAVPDILRSNLSSVVLQLKALGIHDVLGFDFMDRPPQLALEKALIQLYQLGCLTDDNTGLTPLGQRMVLTPHASVCLRVSRTEPSQAQRCL